MEIKTKLTEKDFINVNLVILYKKLSIKIAIGLVVLVALLSLYYSISNNKPFAFDTISWPLIFFVLLPLFTIIGAKRNFRSNERIKETIEYKFEDDYLHVKGESFTSQLSWDKIFKVTLDKNWLLIWQSRQVANVIPRRDIWEGDVKKLKEILDRHNVKNNL
jgi:hypothetical protein